MRGRGWMAVAPDGRTVATGRLENGEAYIDVLRPALGTAAGILASRPASDLRTLLFSPDGRSLFGSLSEVVGNGSNEHRLRSDLGPCHRKTDQSAHGRAATSATFTLPRVIVL